MKTVVIKVEERNAAKKGYPVRLHVDDGKAKWTDKGRALAEAIIPTKLGVSAPPVDPQDGQNLKPENLRKIILEEKGASRRLEAVGEYLYKLLFRDKIEEAWQKLSDKYPGEREQKEGRRTILDIAPKELRMMPWELMATDKPLFMDWTNPFSRGPLLRLKQVCYQWPLHVLVVVGSDANDQAVQAETEIASIEEALLHFDIPVELEILTRPTHLELEETLGSFRPHIFHFIGHGRKASGVSNAPVLAFEAGASGPAWEWNERMIAVDLNTWTPRLAFINACRSSTEEEANHSWGITQRFIEAGVPAVFGMQADILGSAAALFPGEIYRALSSEESALDVALAKARGNVARDEGSSEQHRDWALATFHLSVDPVRVVDMQPPATNTFRSEINQQFAGIKLFVDRVDPRRRLWRAVEQTPLQQTPIADQVKKLLIIRGILESGKTWLVYWCLRSCKWRALTVHYVSLKKKATRNEGPKNILDVLRAIIANDSNSQFGQALPAKSFYRFNALVNYLLGPSEPNPSSIPAARRVEDKGFSFRDLDHESINAILDAFKLGLRNASQHQILVLALDDLSTVTVRTDHFQRYLLPNLITPIAKGSETNLKNVRMIAAVKEDEYGDLGLSELENYALTIKLDWLDKDERALFARDLCILKQVKQGSRDRIQSLLNEATVPTVAPSKVFNLVMMWTNDFLSN